MEFAQYLSGFWFFFLSASKTLYYDLISDILFK